jgi:PncC family amidohydrolase
MNIEIIGEIFRDKQLTLAVAESCTGGLIGSAVTAVSGSSDYFLGGVIAYSNRIKIEQLNVAEDALKLYGAVSDVIACQMADGVRKSFGADVAVSVTGIAGPDGGTDEKPVGTVFVGLATGKNTASTRFQFSGDRISVRQQTVAAAIEMLASI